MSKINPGELKVTDEGIMKYTKVDNVSGNVYTYEMLMPREVFIEAYYKYIHDADRPLVIYGQSVNQDDPYPSTVPQVYLHGELEKLNGFDLVYIPKEDIPKEEGIYKCKVKTWKTKEVVSAILYYWKAKEPLFNNYLGLVCKFGDDEAMEYAREQYDNKVNHL